MHPTQKRQPSLVRWTLWNIVLTILIVGWSMGLYFLDVCNSLGSMSSFGIVRMPLPPLPARE